MIILNFSHPLTAAHLAQVEALAGQAVGQVRDAPPHFDHGAPLAPQARALADRVGLSAVEWQTARLLVNPPGYAPGAVALLAELHGRMGHFPAVLRLRPEAGSTPTRYVVAELLNLQEVRDGARATRGKP